MRRATPRLPPPQHRDLQVTRNTPIRLTRTFLSLSRVLLSLVGCLLFLIPWSERYCFLDNFPHGQDFETNLLAFFALAGLMLLVAHLCQQSVAAFLTLGCWIS